MPKKRWIRREQSSEPPPGGRSAAEAAILAARGLIREQEIEAFLSRRYAGETDPFQLQDMALAIDRLEEARRGSELVVVYGDYDADGTTGTALLTGLLRSLGLRADWYIPNRFTEGYGLNAKALRKIQGDGAAVVISVDCGIRSNEIVQSAKGLDIIITDHHLPGPDLPPALAVIDPNRADDQYPFKGLAGVGIAFKLAQGLIASSGGADPKNFLDLVAVGTVADLAPLVTENRSLVAAGIDALNSAARPGLRALAEFAGYSRGSINSDSIGFGLGPRLNAAGRLADAGMAVDLLLSTEGPEAWEAAGNLDRLNRERQQLTTENLELARLRAQDQQISNDIVISVDKQFHEGVLGLVAGRLMDEAYRPVLVAKIEGDLLRGSARSIEEFHITQALQQCDDLLTRFGGHAQAAGFSLSLENQAAFVERIAEIAAEQLAGLDLRPSLEIDASVGFDELDEDLMAFMDQLQPCGIENPYPVLSTAGVEVHAKRTVGQGGRHLKLTLRQAGRIFDAIAFGFGDRINEMSDRIELAYRLERNEFRGVVSLQLNIQDFRAL